MKKGFFIYIFLVITINCNSKNPMCQVEIFDSINIDSNQLDSNKLTDYDSFRSRMGINILHFPPFDYSKFLKNLSVTSISCKSDFTKDGARRDIKQNNLRILFHGGWGGVPKLDSKTHKIFENKYKVSFKSQGCIRYAEDDEKGYNEIIFKFLDVKFGKGWRNEIPCGVVGLECVEISKKNSQTNKTEECLIKKKSNTFKVKKIKRSLNSKHTESKNKVNSYFIQLTILLFLSIIIWTISKKVKRQ